MDTIVTSINGSKVVVSDWHAGMIALCAGEHTGAAVLHRSCTKENVNTLKYSCSSEGIYDPIKNSKLSNRKGDAIANIRVYGNISKASLCFAPGPIVPLSKISDEEWYLPDFTDDHFLKSGCLPFCHDYLNITLKEPGRVTITWDAFLLSPKLRREIMRQSSKPHCTESATRRFTYSTGTLMSVQDL
jgi:hypothetical protein